MVEEKLRQKEAEALKDLENLIGIPIPRVDNIHKSKNFGVKIDNNKVTILMLGGQALQNLDLEKLTMLPESIGNLKSLDLLYLQNNDLKSIPQSIGNLKSLKYLNLRSNKLEKIPETIGNLKLLVILLLDDNPIKKIPESIGNLKDLKELYLDNTELTVLPESIGNLSSLTFLKLSNNQLKTLPESIGNIQTLKFLFLQRNELTELPESFKNLTSLIRLFLNKNKLKGLPQSVKQLLSLEMLPWVSWDDPEIIEIPKRKVRESDDRKPHATELLEELNEAVKSRKLGTKLEKIDDDTVSLRSSIMSELKPVMQSHKNGNFLQKPNKVILKEREKDRLKRLNELKELEKALKKKVQVKFLVNLPELEDIKRGALISQQTQSEFIRSAIRDKIRIINAQSQIESLDKYKEIPENKLNLEELKRIRSLLERIEKKDK